MSLDNHNQTIPYYIEYKAPTNLRRIQFLNNFQRKNVKNVRLNLEVIRYQIKLKLTNREDTIRMYKCRRTKRNLQKLLS
jgi:hypothetical protein